MSDPEDIKALKAGDNDMVRRDLRDEDLSGHDFSGRDFTGALIERANFDRSNLSGAILSKTKSLGTSFKGSNLTNIKLNSTAVVNVSFKGAKLNAANLRGSHFHRCDFSGCDISDANFMGAFLEEGCNFDDCIITSNTFFDEVSIFRPLSMLPAFRFYKVERGKLIRKKDDEISLPDNNKVQPTFDTNTDELAASKEEIRNEALNKIAELEQQLSGLYEYNSNEIQHGGIGHNNPPEAVPIERTEITSVLEEAREIAQNTSIEIEDIERAKTKLASISSTIFKWVAKNCDTAATEFSKEFGKTLGSKSFVIFTSLWLTFSGEIQTLGSLLQQLIN